MTAFKTELTTEYSTIIDLQGRMRSLLSPYSQYTSRVLVQNVNRPEENLVLIFGSDNYVIECNWNQLKFTGEGRRVNYEDSTGPLRFYFEILDKLLQLDSFGKIEKATLVCHDLVGGNDRHPGSVHSFNRDYLSGEVREAFDAINDTAVTVHGDIQNGKTELTFGPFIPEVDPERHNLRVFQGKTIVDFSQLSGILARTKIVKTRVNRDAGHNLYDDLAQRRDSLLDQIPNT